MGEYVATSQMEEHVDLVVVGGGPTGLLSALLARRLGLTVSIVGESILVIPIISRARWLIVSFSDAKSGPLDLGRADALNARTQQYFEVVGILDELIPDGLKCNSKSETPAMAIRVYSC